MPDQRMKLALTALQWTLGLVILIDAALFLLPSARHDFARTHMPEIVRQVLGWGEIVGSILMLIPQTAIKGAWLLMGTFLLAIVLHFLHGTYNVGDIAIYTAAAWVIATGKGSDRIS